MLVEQVGGVFALEVKELQSTESSAVKSANTGDSNSNLLTENIANNYLPTLS